MPKLCIKCGKYPVFSHNYCKGCQMYRTDEKWLKSLQKQPKTQSKIKPVSEKQSKKLQDYEKGKREKEKQLRASGEWNCIFCGKPFGDSPCDGWHHLLGRDGDLVSDMRYIFPAHTRCHLFIYHYGTYELLSSQRWYPEFLDRIKAISPELYEKELNKENK